MHVMPEVLQIISGEVDEVTGFYSAVSPITGEYNFWLWHVSKPNCSLLLLPRSTRCTFPISVARSWEESGYQTLLFRTVPTAVL